MKWTAEQQNAIDARGGRILVSAAAGSGKTAVLVERVLRLITDAENPCDVDKLLIVTFTEAAASEMREKIVKALSERIKNGETSLARQLTLIPHAHISTVHAFCTYLLRTYFYALDIEPDFRIADSAEAAMLKTDALNEAIDDFYENRLSDSAFLDILNIFTNSKNDDELCNTISTLYEFISSNPFPQKWLDSRKSFYDISENTPFADTVWGKYLTRSAQSQCEELLSIAAANQSALDLADDEALHKKFGSAFADDLVFALSLCTCIQNGDYRGFTVRLATNKFTSVAGTRKVDPVAAELLNQKRKLFKERAEKLREIHIPIDEKSVFEDIQSAGKITNVIFEMVSDYSRRYSEKKKKRGLLDFSDLEHFALELLIKDYDVDSGKYTRTAIAETVADSFSHIIVDEYQDTNLTQDLLFRAVSNNERNIFMVGDVKQSIYRFRHAMPELFIGYKDTFPAYDGSNTQRDMRIILGKNFRSRTQVIDSVNAVFESAMSRNLGDIDYNEDEKLYFGAESYPPSDTCQTEIDYLDLSAKDADDDEKALEKEVRFIACRIGKLFSDKVQVYDRVSDTMRDIRYSDIAILIRAAKDKLNVFEELLPEYGIPFVADTDESYFQTPEVSTVLSLLRAMNNPFDDISLAAAMRSPIFLFTSDELARIRIGRTEMALIESVREKSADSDELGKKCAMLISRLEQYRLMAVNVPVNILLQRLYEETGFMSVAAAMDNGELRCANLRLLEDYARRYEKTSFKGLYNFVLFIDKMQAQRSEPTGSAKAIDSNAVRIVTIHKSKGLEYPVCFIANSSVTFKHRDLTGKLLFDGELGVAFKLRDSRFGALYKTPMLTSIIDKKKRDTLSEEMRVFYVALTRAKEKLIIPITVKDIVKYREKFKLFSESDMKPPCDSTSSWLSFAVARSKPELWDIVTYSDSEDVKNAVAFDPFIKKLKHTELFDVEQADVTAAIEDDELYEKLSQRLSCEHTVDTHPSRVSVTELKRAFVQADSEHAFYGEFEPVLPDFMEKPVGVAALRGTAMHIFMEFADFSACSDVKAIENEALRLHSAGFLDKTEYELLNCKKLADFFTSSVAKRLQSAKSIYREKKFSILSELDMFGISRDETVLQGIIDLYFEDDNGNFTVIDFKTDRKTPDELVSAYKTQLDAYTKAISEIHGIPMESIERYIWSFYNSSLIKI